MFGRASTDAWSANPSALAKERILQIRLDRVPVQPYPELPSVLGEFACGAIDILGSRLTGIYLVGSLATGDFDPDSDIDFMAVIEEDLAQEEVTSLQALHLRLHGMGCYPAEHLEGSYMSRAVLGCSEKVGVTPTWFLDNTAGVRLNFINFEPGSQISGFPPPRE